MVQTAYRSRIAISTMTFIPLDKLRSLSLESSQASSRQPSAVSASQRLPPWFKIQAITGPDYLDIKQTMDRLKLHTICEEARCPNRWECWNARTATFLILGDICTRRCHYCSVETGRPMAIDHGEPRRVAEAIHALALKHAVITSVNRDELADGGAGIFAETIRHTRQLNATCTIEVLIPDFEGNETALATVCAEKPEILNHNIETVRRLFPSLRPQGKYQRSIELLGKAKHLGMRTKSGLILGMGETMGEAREVMRDLRSAGCDIMTIGQYLQPTREHLPVARYYDPNDFAALKEEGIALGFTHVESGPLVRSSYHAEQHLSTTGHSA
ncbi:MAG: lipoyl synthase [Nitrospiraceae bacterium]